MTQATSIPPEQRELEVLRRLASHVRSTYRNSAGVFSLRTHRVEQWNETDLPALLKTLDAVQGTQARGGSNWETHPDDEAGVFVLNGQRVKIVPVEPTERMVHDDNATDPPMLHPLGFLNSDTLRYVYKQLLRVAPVLTLDEQAVAAPIRSAADSRAPAAQRAAAEGRNPNVDAALAALRQAIADAEHKPGTWAKAVTEFGAIAARSSAAVDAPMLPGDEKPFAHFSYKRDGWLATAAVNALPVLLELAELLQARQDVPRVARSHEEGMHALLDLDGQMRNTLENFASGASGAAG